MPKYKIWGRAMSEAWGMNMLQLDQEGVSRAAEKDLQLVQGRKSVR
jgi:hypothetical protein